MSPASCPSCREDVARREDRYVGSGFDPVVTGGTSCAAGPALVFRQVAAAACCACGLTARVGLRNQIKLARGGCV